MKKFINILCIGFIGIISCGCNQYFISEIDSGATQNGVYTGAYNRRDFTWADVVLYQQGTDKRCEGVVHINAPSRSITLKNDRVDAIMKLACTDGKLMNINWELRKNSFADGYGEGVDQYNNIYRFKTVSKSEFKEIAPEIKKVSIPNKDFILRY